MAITITAPAAAGSVGPGLVITGTFDSPLSDDIYLLTALHGTDAVAIGTTVSGSPWACTLGFDITGHMLSGDQVGAAAGAPITISVHIARAAGGTADSDTFSGFAWDPISGLPVYFAILQAAGGIDPAKIDAILANTQGGSFKSPLIGVTSPVGVTGNPFDGGFTWDLPLPGAGIVVGLTWEVVTHPLYVGGLAGVIEEANRRLLQLVVFHSLLGGATFADQIVDSHALTGTLWFDSYDPTGVSAFIYPGFSVNFSWLVIP